MTKLEFQSTPPAREATGDGDGDGDGDEFQSTPPAREATPIPAFCDHAGLVSIHAPREGGDGVSDTYSSTFQVSIHAPREGGDLFPKSREQRQWFQSTPPAREATQSSNEFPGCIPVSIHAPREGGDLRQSQLVGLGQVSIHAPREGGDGLPG